MDPAATSDDRPWLLLISTGERLYRQYLLASIAPHYRVHLFTGTEPSWERDYLHAWTVLDFTDTIGADHLIEAARALADTRQFAGVLCWDEARILQSAKVAQSLGLPGGDPDMVLRCRDKYLTRQALARAGVAQPESVLVDSLEQALQVAERIGYPVVLKPRAMAASLGVIRVDNPEELSAHFGFTRDTMVPGAWHYEAILVEQYLTGPEISLDSAVHRGEVLPLFLARKQVDYPPYFEEVGHTVSATEELLDDPQLLALTSATHRALGFTEGMTHTEFKLTPDGPKVIEVNARLGGDLIPYLGQRATGLEPGRIAAAVACGQRPRLRSSLALTAAVRFFYVDEPDTTIVQVGFALDEPPAALDHTSVLARPGQVLSPPPGGTTFGRIALATAVAEDIATCVAALDVAEAALFVRS